ncbi:hypothetical protein DH2020_026966 [Rehmannia glutinosa]|uniref:2-oxoadipate dioxygenase/decarboxylase n=1 Tax=Rehmannia glutinosa TaxID=99300 RepID=A0ABR0VVL6_REHGL
MLRFPPVEFSLRPSLSSLSSSSSLFLSNSPNNFISPKIRIEGDFNFLGRTTHHLSAMSASINEHHGHPQDCSFRGGESFFMNILATMETVYLNRNPTAKAILELVRSVDDDRLCYDHFAFRTYGVNGHGIDSMAKLFMDFGYVQREELRFPAKKLKAFWFAPNVPHSDAGAGVNGPLRGYLYQNFSLIKCLQKLSALGCLTWEKPSYSEFQQLARESEYAAWTLVNGYMLNHVTISAHRLKSHLRNIRNLNQFIEENGFKLNSEGGILKVSPDGLLLQSSTVADSTSFQFAEGIVESIPCSYIEFAERLVLPQFKNLPENEVKEIHRRDGFEVGNADKIFESTSMDQLTRKVA